MKKLVLTTLAVASIFTAIVVLASCFFRTRPAVWLGLRGKNGVTVALLLDGGKVAIEGWWIKGMYGDTGLDFTCNVPRARLPDPKNAIWNFDACFIRWPGNELVAVCFPFWFALLPSLGAPIFWVRSRRHKTPRGFPISTTV